MAENGKKSCRILKNISRFTLEFVYVMGSHEISKFILHESGLMFSSKKKQTML